MSGPNDVDRLLQDWDEVASTAKPPAQDPRREMRTSSALPVSMLLVAVVVIAGIAVLGRTMPGPGPGESAIAVDNGPVSDTVEEDGFRLTLTSDHAVYADGDAIVAGAVVEYLGPDETLEVTHGLNPVLFRVEEVDGARHADAADRAFRTTVFVRGEPVTYPWAKLATYAPDDPSQDRFVRAYLEGDDLRLPIGTWRLVSDFATGLTASVTVRVVPATAAATPVPSPEPASPEPASPEPTPSPVGVALTDRGVADDGRFLVELTTDGTTFEEGDTIHAGTEVTFLGPEGSLVTLHGSPAVTFRVEEVGGRRNVEGGQDMICLRSTFVRDEAVPFPWTRSGSYSTSNPGPNDRFAKTYLDAWPGARNGELRLPAGTWRLSADFDVNEGDCGPANPRTASVVIRVDPATASGPEPSATPGPTPTPIVTVFGVDISRPGPVARCEGVTEEDCEHAVALVREADPGAYLDATIAVVADTCTPGAVCDRQYPFDATVILVPEGGTAATSPSFAVHGVDGPESVGEQPGYVGSWMADLVDKAAELVPILSAPPLVPGAVECPAALLEGTLVPDPSSGLAIEADDGSLTTVVWPFGYARDDMRGPALVDPTGDVVGVVGDRMAIGGAGPDGTWAACGGVARADGP